MHNYAGTCKGICSNNLVYKFSVQRLPLKSSVFVVHFSNALWHGYEAFPKVSSQNEIVPLLVIFHLPYSKYRSVKICFYSCRYQNQNFSLVSHSCRSCSTCVVFVSFVQHSCCTCGALVSLVSHSCRTRVASVSMVSHCCRSFRTCVACVRHLCCKLDQMKIHFYVN